MVHAAMVVYRHEVGSIFPTDSMDCEELLCYWQGILVHNAANLLADVGLWRDLAE